MNYHLILNTTIGCWNCSKTAVREALSRYKDKPVNVLISSPGGFLDDGLNIMQQFRDHGDVTAYISGFTASAATVAAMGAKKIVMGKYSFFLVHKCSNFIDAWGSYNADQIQKLIDELTANKKENDKIDVVLAQLYADRCDNRCGTFYDFTGGDTVRQIPAHYLNFTHKFLLWYGFFRQQKKCLFRRSRIFLRCHFPIPL